MRFNDYQNLTGRTRNITLSKEMELGNYALGMVCEAGEVGDALKKHIYHGHSLNSNDIIKEMGDTLWYMSNICTLLDIDFDEISIQNIKKLEKRYPEGFSKNDSINRVE